MHPFAVRISNAVARAKVGLVALLAIASFFMPMLAVLAMGIAFLRQIQPEAVNQGDLLAIDYVVTTGEEPSDITDDLVPEGKPSRIEGCRLRAVDAARAKLGDLRETAANRLVVSRVIRDTMSEWGMRPSHVAFYAPTAVELYFIPTEQMVVAKQIRDSRVKAEQVRRAGLAHLA